MTRKRHIPLKPCAHCGEIMPRDYSRPAREYDVRKYCSRACTQAAQRMECPERICEYCGATYARKATLRPGQFLRSRFCSRRCNALATLSSAVEGSTGQTLCECGRKATKTVYFTQATADGYIMPGHLKVCADCYDFMIESDPGCSAKAQQARHMTLLWDDDARVSYSPPHGGFARGRSYT